MRSKNRKTPHSHINNDKIQNGKKINYEKMESFNNSEDMGEAEEEIKQERIPSYTQILENAYTSRDKTRAFDDDQFNNLTEVE